MNFLQDVDYKMFSKTLRMPGVQCNMNRIKTNHVSTYRLNCFMKLDTLASVINHMLILLGDGDDDIKCNAIDQTLYEIVVA